MQKRELSAERGKLGGTALTQTRGEAKAAAK